MPSLVHVIRSFQSGSMSRDELFAKVDLILEDGRADEAVLLETLDKENTKVPLPADVHERMQEKIEKAAHGREPVQKSAEQTGAAEIDDADNSRTRLATSLFVSSPPATSTGNGGAKDWPGETSRPPAGVSPDNQPERVKDTGDVLNGRFVLEECIGTGGMSSVYKALDRRKLEANDRNPYVAVKILNLEFRAHPDSLIALQREAKKSQSLAHPNIVRVYDFDRDDSTVYMTMEYLTGKSLAKVLRAPGFKGLPEQESMRILEAIAEALRFAHDNGIIHADFKPANVILTEQGQIKVIDFGIARAFQKPDDTDMEATRFDPGSLGALTPTYASPEMLEHQKPDPRDDIYALACIAYELFTGRHPFGRMQATEARDGGLEAERRNLSRRQCRALKSALAFDRDKRTPNIQQFLADLRPKSTVSVPSAVIAGSKIAVVVAAVALVYHYFLADAITEYQTRPKVVVVTPPDAAGVDDDAGIVASKDDKPASSDTRKEAARPVKVEPVVQREPPAATAPAAVVAAPVRLSQSTVTDVLKDIKCAALNSSVKDGAVNLRGYVSKKLDLKGLRKELLALPGARSVNADLKQVNPAQCAAIDLLAPYWTGNQSSGQGVSIGTRAKDNVFTEGEPLVVQISTPGYESYVNLDYFSLDGGVVHMVPSPRAVNNQAPANYKATIGDLGEWTIAGPYGRELVSVLITPTPLFDGLRKEYEKNEEYLAALGKQLQRIAARSGKDRIVADFVMIETRPK